GYSYQENDYTNHYMENWDFPTDRFSWNDIGLGRAISSGDYQGLIRSYKSTTNLIGFFGRLTYNYDQKYLLMASVRREEASQLWGTKNPWVTFPAVSAGWRISREPFMQGQKRFPGNSPACRNSRECSPWIFGAPQLAGEFPGKFSSQLWGTLAISRY